MDFEEFFRKKRIDLAALGKAEPALLSEFKTHFEQMGEKSFDHTKKYWFNKLRLIYHLAPEPKVEKVIIENQLAEQTIIETLEEGTPPPANVGFKPRFKPGMGKRAEAPAPEAEKPAESPETPTTTPAKVGFTPRFKAGITKPAETIAEPKEESKTEEQPAPAPPKPTGFTPRFKAGVTKPAAAAEPIKEEPKAETLPETISEEKPAEENTTSKPPMGFKPHFQAKKPKGGE